MKAVTVVALMLISCTDAEWENQIGSLGRPGHIVCYSGGKVIYEGDSTEKIATTASSDGWEFKDKATDKLVRVSGSCVIVN
jgi:hypothetical protein